METDDSHDTRIRARDAATRMLNRLTAGVAFAAIAGVGLLGAVSAYTIPGAATAADVASTTAASGSTSSSASTSSGLQSSSGTVSSSSGSGVAVSGGS